MKHIALALILAACGTVEVPVDAGPPRMTDAGPSLECPCVEGCNARCPEGWLALCTGTGVVWYYHEIYFECVPGNTLSPPACVLRGGTLVVECPLGTMLCERVRVAARGDGGTICVI